MTSSKRVLAIPELLELILEYAEVKEIFCWQRVDSGWHSVIQDSHRIQDKILFRSPIYETKPSAESDNTNVVINSEWNPIILQLGRGRAEDFNEKIALCRIYKGCEWDTYELNTNTLQDLGFGNAEGSWKKIFFIKPAPRGAMIIWRHSDLQSVVRHALQREGGITLGDLSQACQEQVLRALTEFPALEGAHGGTLRFAFFC